MGNAVISREIWREAFEGFHIYKCAVRRKNIFNFILIEKQEGNRSEPDKRLVTVLTDGEGKMAYGQYSGYESPRLAVAQLPMELAVMVTIDGDVAVLGGSYNDAEKNIPIGDRTTPLFSSASAVTTIDGYVYAVGPWRSVCRRINASRWENLADRATLPEPRQDMYGGTDQGFDVIDGYSAQDIYCGGGKGDLWQFDGKRWNHCPVPTNMYIESICCAGDGYVYVGLQSGSIMRGRKNKWKVIHIGALSLPFKDMVWFAGKVWCTSDYGIWTIEKGKLKEPDLPPEVRSCSGNLSVGDGVMLLAGIYGACVYDGRKWSTLVPPAM